MRCGDRFEPREARQRDCDRCLREVMAIVNADAKRRLPRFPAKDWTRATSW
jgi:hypothetical protein